MSSERGSNKETTHELTDEGELRESEAWYRSLFTDNSSVMLLIDPITGKIVDANYAANDYYGYAHEDLTELSITDLNILPSDEVKAEMELSVSGNKRSFNFRHRLASGEVRDVEVHSGPIVVENRQLLYSIVHDITERKRAEEAVRASERRQAFLLRLSDAIRLLSDPSEIEEAVSNTVVECLQTDRCFYCEIVDGKSIVRRESAREGLPSIVGVYDMSELPVFQAVVDAGRPFVVNDARTSDVLDEPLRHMCVQLQVISFIGVPVIKEGEAAGILCVVQGEPRRWTDSEVGFAAEATNRTWEAVERARGKEALEKSEANRIVTEVAERERQRLFQVLESLPVLVCLITPDYHIPFANRAFRERFGESKGRHCYEYCYGFRTEPCEFCESLKPLETGRPHHWEVKGEDGSIIAAFDMPFTDADGSPMVLEMDMDITEQRGMEEALREANETLEAKVKERTRELSRSNEELQQFAYVASHDLQEPLRMVTSYLGLLEKKFGDELPDQAEEYMRIAVDGSLRMRELIDDLLRYSRIDSGSILIEEIDMNEKVKTVIDDLHVMIKETGAEIIVNDLPTIYGEKTQMKQLLTNLFSNAIKFRSDRPPRVEISAVDYGGKFVFSVKDNGIGIDPKYADKLFKMFSRLHTRDEYPGTGIGLAISKKIVERHGGRIWFESEPGKGTTFYFTVPA